MLAICCAFRDVAVCATAMGWLQRKLHSGQFAQLKRAA
ncbi:hypothetical protein VHA_001149 [Grimontia hollisae CIP 101886]|uniref:Uncharacterized protein n=1 Tax=Grimontia hollisae CIP 101886 TaxID=675812 RepID=D0I5Y2_GRIHO|nr:hypothetical protein VHA_001149 [Grimontia hollisae CIP 101886]